jgi:hypothetical protein
VLAEHSGAEWLADIVMVLSASQVLVQWHVPVQLPAGVDCGWNVTVAGEDSEYSVIDASTILRVVKTIPQLVPRSKLGAGLRLRGCVVEVLIRPLPIRGLPNVRDVERPLVFSERGLLHVG